MPLERNSKDCQQTTRAEKQGAPAFSGHPEAHDANALILDGSLQNEEAIFPPSMWRQPQETTATSLTPRVMMVVLDSDPRVAGMMEEQGLSTYCYQYLGQRVPGGVHPLQSSSQNGSLRKREKSYLAVKM